MIDCWLLKAQRKTLHAYSEQQLHQHL